MLQYITGFLLLFLVSTGMPVFAQGDTTPPILSCKQVSVTPNGLFCSVNIPVQEFIDTVYDDSNTPAQIALGMRKSCTGTGFPENQTTLDFACIDNFQVEVWARDAAGNTASCVTTIYIPDPGNFDPGFGFSTQTTDGQDLPDVDIHVRVLRCASPDSADFFYKTKQYGNYYSFGVLSIAGEEMVVTPSKTTAPLNGVSAYDLSRIQRHLLGIEFLDAPYRILAADVNLDGKVSTYDIVLLNKLLLGHIDQLPHGQSWRFLPKDFVFPDPQDPFATPFPEQAFVPGSADPPPSNFKFIGFKIGDINGNADPEK